MFEMKDPGVGDNMREDVRQRFDDMVYVYAPEKEKAASG
ncbi:hypothetical protein RKLH11_2767 [Rhodobacteraceae bacterium KLH11]|nr:hypothetical protein RKLH11_2767 [Rhodobacteraceae bacterium KLH11]